MQRLRYVLAGLCQEVTSATTATPRGCAASGTSYKDLQSIIKKSLCTDLRQLRAGSFEVDATCPLGTPLMNGGVEPAAEIVTPLTARGIVFLGLDGGPVVLCVVDWTGIGNESHDFLCAALAGGVGTGPERVALHTVHQHDAPGSDQGAEEILAAAGLSGQAFNAGLDKTVAGRLEAAARAAADTAIVVARIGTGSVEVDRVASNRHIRGDDGVVYLQRQSASGRNVEAAAAPEGVVDRYLRVLGLFDESGETLASLSFYATHPMSHYGKGSVNWDFIGMAREQHQSSLPSSAGCLHFNGAGGNVAAGKYNDGKPERRAELAARVYAAMGSAWEQAQNPANQRDICATDVSWAVEQVSLPLSDYLSEPEAEARMLAFVEDSSQDRLLRQRTARDLAYTRRVNAGANSFGSDDALHVVTPSQLSLKMLVVAQGRRIAIGCLQLGHAHILSMPGELFVEYQLAAQGMVTKDKEVMMAAYGDYGPGYIGTEAAYSYGPLCYETAQGPPPRGTSRVASTTEHVLMTAMQSLLTAR